MALLLGGQSVADLSQAGVLFPAFGSALWWCAAVALVVQALLLCWARHAQKSMAIAVPGIFLLLALTTPGAVLDIAAIAVPVAVFLVFRTPPPRGIWVSLAVAALIFAAGDMFNSIKGEGTDPAIAFVEALVQVVGLFGIPILLATVLRARRESRDAHGRELRALTRERDALVDATVARERTAMARELHDIAAHHLSGIALMASVVERQVDRDPDAAREAARQIRAESTAVLQNLRRVVGLLRDDGAAERSVENFASVPDLVAGLAIGSAGEVRLIMLPTDSAGSFGDGIGPLAQLAAYRTIQESLANAAMHAPGAACLVEVDDTRGGEVEIVVRNSPAADSIGIDSAGDSSGGFGLIGMRERADLIGADLQYGHTPDGGWEVRLTIPRDAVAKGTGQTGAASS